MRPRLTLFLPTESDTTRLGHDLARRLRAGDVVLLEGPIGSGKTHLARAIISTLLEAPEDIPSPTYTLLQTYSGRDFSIWHADLYRLTDSSELGELGLLDAFEDALVLIEWPDRLPSDHLPASAIRVQLQTEGDGRRVFLDGSRQWLEGLADA